MSAFLSQFQIGIPVHTYLPMQKKIIKIKSIFTKVRFSCLKNTFDEDIQDFVVGGEIEDVEMY